MTYVNDLLIHLAALAVWLQTSDGTNILATAICIAALCGAGSRICLLATLLMHLLLVIPL